MAVCKICNQPLLDSDKTQKLGQVGANSINSANERRHSSIRTEKGDIVHTRCQQNWINRERVEAAAKAADSTDTAQQRLRSSTPTFNFKEQCLFCGHVAQSCSKRRSTDIFTVRTKDFIDSLMKLSDRRKDSWANEVKQRIISNPDLIAADAIYHKVCSGNFRTFRAIPQQYNSGPDQVKKKVKLSSTRSKDDLRNECFNRVIEYFEENDDEQTTISDLVRKMSEFTKECECDMGEYSVIWMKKRIKDHFGERVLITTVDGKPDVITLLSKASTILSDFHDKPKN